MPATCSQRATASGDSGEAGIRPLCRSSRRPSYVELHCHSAYSFGDGASAPEELAHRAAELGYEALAITDHDGVWGSMEFALACRELGLRPITGAELTLSDGAHLTLLVESQAGYRNLCRLLTAAHSHTRDGPQRAAGQPSVSLAQVEAPSRNEKAECACSSM